MFRFTGLPNNAQLEMVKVLKQVSFLTLNFSLFEIVYRGHLNKMMQWQC